MQVPFGVFLLNSIPSYSTYCRKLDIIIDNISGEFKAFQLYTDDMKILNLTRKLWNSLNVVTLRYVTLRYALLYLPIFEFLFNNFPIS